MAVYYDVQEFGRAALNVASKTGHVECVRLLLDWGAGVDEADVSSRLVTSTHRVARALRGVRQALVYVCMCARVCEGYWLCVGGSFGGGWDGRWLRCFPAYCRSWHGSLAAADWAVQEFGGTALHCASEGGHVECVLLLLDRGAGVDVVSVSSWLVVLACRVV